MKMLRWILGISLREKYANVEIWILAGVTDW